MYRIASFNMYKFNYRSDKEISKDFSTIAKIILENKFDIVAMQEVISDDAIKNKLMPYLPGWTFRWNHPRYLTENRYVNQFSEQIEQGIQVKGYSKSKMEAEGYAFLWNTKKFMLAQKKGQDIEPRIFNQYRVDYSKGQMPLARNPYYGRFLPLTADQRPRQFEIRLLNTHITFGDAGKADARRHEFEVLVDQIYKRISKEDATPWPVYAIMLGDYNLNLKREWTQQPYLVSATIPRYDMEIFDVIEEQNDNSGNRNSVCIKRIKTVQESLSTLKQPNRENFDEDRALANNYDHFSYDIDYDSQNILSRPHVDNQVQRYYSQSGRPDYDQYKKKVSDHLPIYIDLKL